MGDKVKLEDYLVKIATKKNNKRGRCRVCDTEMKWCHERLASHKRSGNCHSDEGKESEEVVNIFKNMAESNKKRKEQSNVSVSTFFTPSDLSSEPLPKRSTKLVQSTLGKILFK